MLGAVLDVEDPQVVGNRGYLRLRVDFDTRRPFTTCVPLPRSISKTTKIMLQYEGLKNYCHKCGRLGHSITACRYKVNPVLLQLGVVYDSAIIAEPPSPPMNTQSNFPDFPNVPTSGTFRPQETVCPEKGR
ncbi:hypothetical protein ACLB2K_043904 [Fragaria x ananassa]